jgi:hypothetical protein
MDVGLEDERLRKTESDVEAVRTALGAPRLCAVGHADV